MSSLRFLPRRSEMFEGLCQARPNALRDGAPPYLVTPAPRSRLRSSPFTITVPVSLNLLASVGPRSGPGAAAGISPARPGRTLEDDRAGCGGAGRALCGSDTRRRTRCALRCLLPDYSTARAQEHGTARRKAC